MFSRFLYLLIAAALAATPACAAENDATGVAPISQMEKADKSAEPEAPPDESRMQVPDPPHPNGEAPRVKPADIDEEYGPATLQAALTPGPDIEKGKEARFTLSLSDKDGKPLDEDSLDERRTKKIHLLVTDETLSDYQHIHPKSGEQGWIFSFTPATAHNYRLWIDVKPRGGEPQMIPLLIKGREPCKESCVDEKASLAAGFGDNKAALTFEGPLKAGAPATATLTLTGPDGKPVTSLEPVMGAYAHVAAFPAGGASPVHVHPAGAQPAGPGDRGASPLSFMLHPEKPGTLKLFVQIGMDNKDIILPFTVKVEDAPAK